MIRLTAAAALAAAVAAATPAAAKIGSCNDPIVWGTTVSATGQYSTFAERWTEMNEVFADEVNKQGGIMVKDCGKKLPLKIITYDDQSVPTNGVTLFEKMATVDNVDFFVGPDWSAFGFPVPPVAEKHKIPMVMANVAALGIFERGLQYMFATPAPTVPNWDVRYFDMVMKQTPKPRTIYFVTQDNPVTKSLTDYWSKKAEEAGLKVVGSESFGAQLKDFTPIVLKIRSAKPDIIYLSSFDVPSVPLIQQMRQLKVKALDVHHTLLSGTLERQLGKDLEGVTGMMAWFEGIKGDYADFCETVLKRSKISMFDYPYTMSRLAAYLVMWQAIEKAGAVDREKVREALHLGTFKAPMGDITFNEGGMSYKTLSYTLQIQGGKVKVVWPQEKATAKVIWPSPTWQ